MLDITNTSHETFKKQLQIQEKSGNIEKNLWKKVYKYVPVLRYIPGILLVWVWNSLSMNACHKESDIDLFIVTKKNRLWSVRVLVTIYFSLLWLRKTWKKHVGRFCLSFFITENAINFETIAIENDIYLYHRILYMKPIIDKKKAYENFIKTNSLWCNFSQREDIISHNKKYIQYSYQDTSRMLYICKPFWDVFEYILRSLFFRKTKKSFHKLWKPFWVIISNDMLKFHDKDTRKSISERIPAESQ